jgi:hypothetical protein
MTKIKFTCGIPTQAECVSTEVTPNEESSLTEESCLSQEQVNEDVFAQLEKIWSQINLEDLGKECLTYTLEETKIVVKNALLKHEEEICLLKDKVTALEERQLCDFPLEGCNLDLGDLVDDCGEQPQTLKDLMQILINNNQTPP